MIKVRKTVETATSKKKSNKKDSVAPKRPLSAYFVSLEDMRKNYKEKFPENKSVAAVTWNSNGKKATLAVVEKSVSEVHDNGEDEVSS